MRRLFRLWLSSGAVFLVALGAVPAADPAFVADEPQSRGSVAASPAQAAEVTVGADVPLVDVRTRAPIWAFAFDGKRFAWSSGKFCNVYVRTKLVGQARAIRLAREALNGGGDYCSLEWLELAVAGNRVLWAGTGDCCNDGYGEVNVATVGRRARTVGGSIQDYHTYGAFVALAGDGSTLVYSVTTLPIVDDLSGCETGEGECCLFDEPASCTVQVTDSRLHRMVQQRRLRLPDTPPVALLAASAGEIAIVEADSAPSNASPEPRPLGAVKVLEATTGELVTEYNATSPSISGIAFADGIVALLISNPDGRLIEWFDAATGLQTGTQAVPADTADGIDLDDDVLVYRVGAQVWALDLESHEQRSLATAQSKPLVLSIEGDIVAWAENRGERGSIRHVTLTAPP